MEKNTKKRKRSTNLKEMLDELESRARDINPHISMDRSTYTKQKSPCKWIDSNHGDFWRSPESAIRGAAFHPSTLQERTQNTSMKKYGVANPAQSPEIINKIKNTITQKYGPEGHMKDKDVIQRFKNTNMQRHGVEYPAQNKEVLAKQQHTNMERYGHWSSLGNPLVKQKIADTNLEKYGDVVPAKISIVKEKMKQTNIERYGVGCVFQNAEVQEKTKKTNTERYGTEYAISADAVREKAKATYRAKTGYDNSFQDPEIRNKIQDIMLSTYGSKFPGGSHEIQKKIHKKQKNSGPEIHLKRFLVNAGIEVQDQFFLNGKMWDLAIFKENKLDLVVEIDGEFHHSLISDPYSSKNQFVPDETRYARLPEDVKFLAIDSKNVKKSLSEISRLLNMDVSGQISEIIKSLINTPFPFPLYDSKRMSADWSHLCNMRQSGKFNNRLMPANSIVTNFHKSIYSSRVGKNFSPVEAWNNEGLLKKCIENRFIYSSSLSSQNIARGFERSKIAPKVTVFQPYLARWLLQTYAPDAKSVIDPFSGFSGRMLGAASLGLAYFGSDIRPEAVAESQEIISFLELKNVNNIEQDAETAILPEADVLLTCPPYRDKEVWFEGQKCHSADHYIELCLQRFKAKTYIFVVDKTERYESHVRLSIDRTSHLSSSSKELILVIDRA